MFYRYFQTFAQNLSDTLKYRVRDYEKNVVGLPSWDREVLWNYAQASGYWTECVVRANLCKALREKASRLAHIRGGLQLARKAYELMPGHTSNLYLRYFAELAKAHEI